MKKDIYYNGKIYKDHNGVDGLLNQSLTNYSVIGTHNFKDGEDVTGRYELQYQEHTHSDEYKFISKELYDLTVEDFTRIVAVPLPTDKLELKNIKTYDGMGEDFCQPITEEAREEVQQDADVEINEAFKNMNMKKEVFNTCINAAISKAKLSATLIPEIEVQDIIYQLENFKK